MARPTSTQLHRAKRKKEREERDQLLGIIDHVLAEALKRLDTLEKARKQGIRLSRMDSMVVNAARQVHVARLLLREYLYDAAP